MDVPPNFFSKYHYVDPGASGVPANHYVIDLMLGDLSRNLLAHEAWQRGEMPWWDPYTEGGKPLAAEANAINVSDPIKVALFHLLPFESAYNWIRILPFLLSGILAFWLLRHWGLESAPAFWSALLYEFAGCNAVMFSGPTVQASFAYYPLLWLLWDRGVSEGRLRLFLVSSAVTGLIFLSGNLQSHSYVFLFALMFAVGYGWRQKAQWSRLFWGIGLSTGIGLGLAAPFVLSQVELYFLSTHNPARYHLLAGPMSMSAFFPWALGTFRTLDASKLIMQAQIGFWIYIGSAALVVSILGMFARVDPQFSAVKRTAILLIGLYLVICSSPLVQIFYTRAAWLAVLGLVVLFALGWRRLEQMTSTMRRTGIIIIAAAILLVAGLHVGALVVYPKIRPGIEQRFLAQEANNPALGSAPKLRRFQLDNLPNEITFKNPETVLAFASLILLGAFLRWRPRGGAIWLNVTLLISTLPLLWYAHRFIPMQPMSLWQRIREGGPEQQRVVAMVTPSSQRLMEIAPNQNEYLFPGAMAQIFRVHVMHGHSSMVVKSAGTEAAALQGHQPSLNDYTYRSATTGMEKGELIKVNSRPSARYFWREPNERQITIAQETLTSITLAITPGPPGTIVRSDTYYPGWKIVAPSNARLMPQAPCFARFDVPSDVTTVTLKFEPRWLKTGLILALMSALALVASLAILWRRSARAAVSNPT